MIVVCGNYCIRPYSVSQAFYFFLVGDGAVSPEWLYRKLELLEHLFYATMLQENSTMPT